MSREMMWLLLNARPARRGSEARARLRLSAGPVYQACPAPQWGQVTVVETLAWKSRPHPHA
jgi:hypothetical protein